MGIKSYPHISINYFPSKDYKSEVSKLSSIDSSQILHTVCSTYDLNWKNDKTLIIYDIPPLMLIDIFWKGCFSIFVLVNVHLASVKASTLP